VVVGHSVLRTIIIIRDGSGNVVGRVNIDFSWMRREDMGGGVGGEKVRYKWFGRRHCEVIWILNGKENFLTG